MSVSLCVDWGNTLGKAAIFEGDTLVCIEKVNDEVGLTSLISQYNPQAAIFCSVSRPLADLVARFGTQLPLITLDYRTPLPIQNGYHTPQTLGVDRLAAAVGAWALYPGQAALVIDAGTCITYDIVSSEGVFLGGSISPGLRMRYQALAHFTAKLPDLYAQKPTDSPTFPGRDTASAIHSGVVGGILAEIAGLRQQNQQLYGHFNTLICGGDANYFETKIKPPIFAIPELTLIGLKTILHYNAI
ncbi:type III pantothenate kinase [Eisenibacter elegans]|uniref:type III pantothenate kinase n=1 Tax=Eisenibacter elegans TaxID=997 RepID=UPI00042124A4|nr:type III pantothenate kinase [Eisenibacter elegans]